MDNNTLIIFLVGLVILVWFLTNQNCDEEYGQDASIRASVGWLAGPKGLYGYDPIDQYAEQIAEVKRREAEHNREGYSSPKCGACMTTEEFEMQE